MEKLTYWEAVKRTSPRNKVLGKLPVNGSGQYGHRADCEGVNSQGYPRKIHKWNELETCVRCGRVRYWFV